jgi:hypothetical protein
VHEIGGGLYYFNARWYDSSTGRFTSEDPVRDGINWFVYVGSNPLVLVDPSGLETIIRLWNRAPDPATGSLARLTVLSLNDTDIDPGHTYIQIVDTQPGREYLGWGTGLGANWQSGRTVPGELLETERENTRRGTALPTSSFQWTATDAQAQIIRDYYNDRVPGSGNQPTNYNLGGSQNDPTGSMCTEMAVRALMEAGILTPEQAAILDPDAPGNWDRWEDRLPTLPDLSTLTDQARDAVMQLIEDTRDLTSPTPAQLHEKIDELKTQDLIDAALALGVTA